MTSRLRRLSGAVLFLACAFAPAAWGLPPNARTITIRNGKVAKTFRLGKLLGAGGWGKVYEALGEGGQRAAIKLTEREDPEGNYEHEHGMMEKHSRRSSGIPKSIIYGKVEGSPSEHALAMELVGTETVLDTFGGNVAPRPIEKALDISYQVADILTAMHGAGDRHNDAQPANWRIDANGKVFLVDLQRANPIGDARRKGHPWPAYHAPEVQSGASLSGSVASDVYTLAVGTLAVITGHSRPSAADIDSPVVPAWVRPILRQGMAADPAARYQTPEAFKSALQHAQR